MAALNQVEHLKEHFGRLCAGDGIAAVDNETRDAVYAQSASHIVLLADRVDILLARQVAQSGNSIQPGGGGNLGQDLGRADITPSMK